MFDPVQNIKTGVTELLNFFNFFVFEKTTFTSFLKISHYNPGQNILELCLILEFGFLSLDSPQVKQYLISSIKYRIRVVSCVA